MSATCLPAIVGVALLALACSPSAARGPSASRALAPRTVLVYVDVSASRRPGEDVAAIARIADGLRARDRLLVYPTGRGLGELRPVLDTLLPGTLIDGWMQEAGLEAGRNAIASSARRRALGEVVRVAMERAVHDGGRTPESRLLEAVCHAGDVARAIVRTRSTTSIAPRIVALILTDGVEESPTVTVKRAVPTVSGAHAMATRLRQRDGCDLSSPELSVRMVGLRHHRNTGALIRWWSAVLSSLGARVAPGDLATAPITDLLS